MVMVVGIKNDMDMALKTKRVKKRRLSRNLEHEDLPDFFEFPSPDDSGSGCQPFRESIKGFLSRHARLKLPLSLFPSLLPWHIALRLRTPLLAVSLYVLEEDVTSCSSTRSVYCDHCRVVGWSGHPVCRKRYHFIIRSGEHHDSGSSTPVEEEEEEDERRRRRRYPNSCLTCGASLLHLSESRCKNCNSCISADNLENWLEDNSHLLHAVVHSNGFGHLLTLNGRQGGSQFLSGRNIMDFWDRLCRSLSVRKISVMDVSKKHGMEYRLLHAITVGHSWYGNWGYQFGAGSYALTQDAYLEAVHSLSTVPLSPFLFQPRTRSENLHSLIAFYQSLSHTPLHTLRDLFSFVSSLLVQKPPSNVLCPWTRNDVDRLQQAMVNVLRASSSGGGGWVTRRALKGTMCRAAAASPELLDYCLNYFGGKVTDDGLVVRYRCNPASRILEYRLEHLSTNVTDNNVACGVDLVYPSEEQIICDLKLLYETLVHPDTLASSSSYKLRPRTIRDRVMDSATKLLDCKQFVKVYVNVPDIMAVERPHAIHLWCDVQLSDQQNKAKGEAVDVVPPELVVLPSNATVADLKVAVTQAFRQVYAMFKRFQAKELVEYGCIDDSITLKFLVGSSASIQLAGNCAAAKNGGLNRFRKERGIESWTVDCSCGAKDDDGERMLACDTCGVWQHTRCLGIDKSDAIPAKFVCLGCMNSYCKNVYHGNKQQHYSNSTKATSILPRNSTSTSTSSSTCTCRVKTAAAPAPTNDLWLAPNLIMTSQVR